GKNPDGLYIEVAKGGSKTWIYRYRLYGRLRKMGLGPFPTISPTEARDKRDKERKLVKDKIDPIEERKKKKKAEQKAQEQQITLAEAREGWRNSGRQLDWNGRDWAGGEGSTAGREPWLWGPYGAPHPKAKKPSKKTQPWLGPYQVTEIVANKGKLIREVFKEIISRMNHKKSARSALQHLCKITEWAIDEKDLPINNPVNLKRDSKFLNSLPSMDYEKESHRRMPSRQGPAVFARFFYEKHKYGNRSRNSHAP